MGYIFVLASDHYMSIQYIYSALKVCYSIYPSLFHTEIIHLLYFFAYQMQFSSTEILNRMIALRPVSLLMQFNSIVQFA